MLYPNDTLEELPVAEAPAPGMWATVREAVRGSHQNYTEGPIGRSIFLLSVPMVLETLMESVFAVADVFYVGHLGPDAIATVIRPSTTPSANERAERRVRCRKCAASTSTRPTAAASPKRNEYASKAIIRGKLAVQRRVICGRSSTAT